MTPTNAAIVNTIIEFAAQNMNGLRTYMEEMGYEPEHIGEACAELAAVAGEDAMLEADDF